jgi:hypothetical protein
MKILAIDAATNCGFAWGDSNGRPFSVSERLRTKEDDPERAFKNIGRAVRNFLEVEQPELVIIEAAINLGGMVELDPQSERGFRFKSKQETIYILCGLVGAAVAICGCYGIPAKKANVQTVRKDFLGVARPENPKLAVLSQCIRLGWLERDCNDDNRGDALALWSFACGKYASRLGQLANVARGE